MNLHINFLNVQNGDSIVIEIESTPPRYIVIDSNLIKKNNQWTNPAYEFLKNKNASTISTLIITHLHQDHYSGVELLLKNFSINKLIIPPLFKSDNKFKNTIIRDYRDRIKNVLAETSDDFISAQMNSLASLLHFIATNGQIIEEMEGKESVLRFPEIPELNSCVYLPLAKAKGNFYTKILDGKDAFDVDFFPEMNDISLAFALKFPNFQVLFTGDSTNSQWIEHKRQMKRDNVTNLKCTFVKAPHHGSKHNNKEGFYDYVLNENKLQRHLFISADGSNHPHKEIFNIITNKTLNTHCTNTSKYCLSQSTFDENKFKDIPKEMQFFIRNYKETRKGIPCKDNIKLSIFENGNSHSISNSRGMKCIYEQ